MTTLIEITILTCIVYLISNSFTYKIGTQLGCQPPLYDIIHEMLPNLSQYVHIRDYILIGAIIPIVFIKKIWKYIPDLWYVFMIVVLIKAVCIFFTYLPSSHPSCRDPSCLDMNHCHHNYVSGHTALFTVLGLLYLKAGLNIWIVLISIFLYCLLVSATRAHYFVDCIQGALFSFLLYFNISKSINT